MSKPTDPCTLEDAAHLEGKAQGLAAADAPLRALGRNDLANELVDLANECFAMAWRIRRQATDLEPEPVPTLH